MGSLKDEIFENEEKMREIQIASTLGITLNELTLLIYETSDIKGDDGTIYGSKIEFDLEKSSKSILKKIKGLRDGYWTEI